MKATRWRRRAASTPSAIARCVLPVPIGPAMTMSSARSRYSQVASWASCGRSTPCSASQSSCSGLGVGESRLAQQARHRAVAAGQHLGLEQLQQELLVVPAVVRRLAHELGVVATDRGQLQLPAVRLEHGRARRVAHSTPPGSKRS